MLPLLQADPFATKGAEYLLVIGFLLALVLFWRWLDRPAGARRRTSAATAAAGPGGLFRVPETLYYHPGHSWAAPGEGGIVTVGIDDFAQKLLGRVSALDLPPLGARVARGEAGWRLRIGADAEGVDVLSPVDGEVVARNEAAIDSPVLVNDDPYGSGWLLRVRGSRIRPDLSSLLHGRLARAWTRLAEQALRRRITAGLGAVMQDGGLPVSGIARAVAPDDWRELVREFLLTR